jgi:hypothetical protein
VRFASAAHPLEEGHVVPDAQRLVVWHRQRERLGQLRHGAQQPVLAFLLRERLGSEVQTLRVPELMFSALLAQDGTKGLELARA